MKNVETIIKTCENACVERICQRAYWYSVVDFENSCKFSVQHLFVKIGIDTALDEPSKVCSTYFTLYDYNKWTPLLQPRRSQPLSGWERWSGSTLEVLAGHAAALANERKQIREDELQKQKLGHSLKAELTRSMELSPALR